MRSDLMKAGVDRIPHRALFRALGLTDEELSRPIIGVVSAKNEIIPGHMHLDKIAEAVKAGIRMAGGTPVEFPAIGVCDGIAMNHEGMFFSLPPASISPTPWRSWPMPILSMVWCSSPTATRSYPA